MRLILVTSVLWTVLCFDETKGSDHEGQPISNTCIPDPIVNCSSSNKIPCEPTKISFTSPRHGPLEFTHFVKNNCLLIGLMSATLNRVLIDRCNQSTRLDICLDDSQIQWSISYNSTVSCFQFAQSNCFSSYFRFRPFRSVDGQVKRAQATPNGLRALETKRTVELFIYLCANGRLRGAKNLDLYLFQLVRRTSEFLNQMNISLVLTSYEIERDPAKCIIVDTTCENASVILHQRPYPLHAVNIQADIGVYLFEASEVVAAIGRAYRGFICEEKKVDIVVILNVGFEDEILAHEIGHVLGAGHDFDNASDYCQFSYCLMSPNTHKETHPTTGFSGRTLVDIATILPIQTAPHDCLREPPLLTQTAYCGNGIVEPGESCDCLDSRDCDACCSTNVCRLKEGATCGSGPCCNMETCKMYTAADRHVCRPATGECDIDDVCDGRSTTCHNEFRTNGEPCEQNQGYCYQGECGNRLTACQIRFGHATGPPECFAKNREGTQFANCGPALEYRKLKEVFVPCEEPDELCGTLHCLTPRLADRFYYPYLANYIRHDFHGPCWSASYFRTVRNLKPVDFGLVPNGASCGERKACLHQKCLSQERFRRASDCPNFCSRKGRCVNGNECLCFNPNDFSIDCSESLSIAEKLVRPVPVLLFSALVLIVTLTVVVVKFTRSASTLTVIRSRLTQFLPFKTKVTHENH